ncbi:UDP-glucuronosyl/UDP-glucosyltransferase [Artemisia annua]|uniref:Glycosyltransferase n=1 Tax=Artemisia annua TaxID=35608 RepID=A0A2U1MXH3_ARTAN|nr:UDP-glucuronosyl/UDP-glucosyltransferase [Artemisia annua]
MLTIKPKATMTPNHKILIVAYPGQGHVNPALRLASRLLKFDVDVSFATSLSVIQRMDKDKIPHCLTLAPFSDGHDNGKQPNTTLLQFVTDFETNGVCAVAEIISSAAAAGKPFSHLVYTIVIPWAARVANAQGLKSALLWCQTATILDIYYYYFNGYQSLISSNNDNPKFRINLPGLPPLMMADLPLFLLSSSPKEHDFLLEIVKDHLDVLKLGPRILVNTFNELEIESIRAIEKLELFPIGPLIPESSMGSEFFEKIEHDYIKWLDTKPENSVIYVSFGTLASLSMDQQEEISNGLLESGRPFLWVIRDTDQAGRLSKIEELKEQGMIVDWCSQVEVLSHQAIGCFVMHCGWNSTIEALAAGVPVVAFPQWSDQAMNAKMIEDVWKTGVRMRKREVDGVVEGKEIDRCVEMVIENEEMKRNAKKWKGSAREALNDSESNLQAFLNDE